MTDKKTVPSLSYMATNPKERNSSRALAKIGDRHELIIRALQEGYSVRDISESLKQHDGIDVSPETIRRHYGKWKRRKRATPGNSRSGSTADSSATQPRAPERRQSPPNSDPTPTQTSPNAFNRVGRMP